MLPGANGRICNALCRKAQELQAYALTELVQKRQVSLAIFAAYEGTGYALIAGLLSGKRRDRMEPIKAQRCLLQRDQWQQRQHDPTECTLHESDTASVPAERTLRMCGSAYAMLSSNDDTGELVSMSGSSSGNALSARFKDVA
jgi:hypothetical protein